MDIISRRFFPEIAAATGERAILVLHGARQTGKSTTLKWWLSGEEGRGRKTLYLDLEDPAMLSLCEAGVDSFLAFARAAGLSPEKLSVALDEVQYLTDPSKFLKLLFDTHGGGLRIAASGSSSFAIKSKFRESLVGRTLPFEVFGLDFGEYCAFVGAARDFSVPWPPELDEATAPLFGEFAETGAYPGLAATRDRSLKARRVRQIVQTYIQTDVRELGKIRYPDRFESLLRLLADQAGALVNVTELSSSLRMARETVEEYLFLLEQTYIIRRVRPLGGGSRGELTKMPKVYFEDNGLLAMCRHHEFLPLDGVLLENAVFGELRKRFGADRVRFWRTSSGSEVDFVLDGGKAAVEVKASPRAADCRGLARFAESHPGARLILCGVKSPGALPSGIEFVYPWHLADMLE